MNKRKQIAKEFAETIKSDKIKQIILFGSVARGDDTPDSDIDILIVSDNKKEIEPLINDTAFQIILEKQEVISPHIASESKLDQIKDYSFMKNIRRDELISVSIDEIKSLLIVSNEDLEASKTFLELDNIEIPL